MHVDFGVVLSEAVAYEVAVVVQAVDAVVAVAAVVVPLVNICTCSVLRGDISRTRPRSRGKDCPSFGRAISQPRVSGRMRVVGDGARGPARVLPGRGSGGAAGGCRWR